MSVFDTWGHRDRADSQRFRDQTLIRVEVYVSVTNEVAAELDSNDDARDAVIFKAQESTASALRNLWPRLDRSEFEPLDPEKERLPTSEGIL